MYRRPFLWSILLASMVLLVIMTDDDAPMQIAQPQLFKDKFYLQDFQAKGYDKEGNLNQVVNGDRLNQPVDTLDNHLVSPRIILIEESKPKWQMTAAKGWLDADHERATLSGNLHLQQLDEGDLQLNTQHVDVDLLLKKVTTEDTVTLTQVNGSTRGTGLEADLQKALFQFNSDVESVYEP